MHETNLLADFDIVEDMFIVGIQELAVEPENDLLLGFEIDALGPTAG